MPILKSDTIPGDFTAHCKGCGTEFPVEWGVTFESQLAAHDCPNPEKLTTHRIETILTRLDTISRQLADMTARLNKLEGKAE